MPSYLTALLLILLEIFSASPSADAHTLNLQNGSYVHLAELVADLKDARIIFIGENHDNRNHHQAQLDIIQALRKSGIEPVIGLEMFRSDSQAALDGWVNGTIDLARFKIAYNDNWKWWDQYRPIFELARTARLPMIGLNFPREISAKVASQGFSSLSKKQLQKLPNSRCFVDGNYSDYIRQSLNSHGHQAGASFENFCEAQVLWDEVMAKNILAYLAAHPKKKMVVLAGNGHAWKPGIPERLMDNGEISWRVLLPEAPGLTQRGSVNFYDGDYLILGLEEEKMH